MRDQEAISNLRLIVKNLSRTGVLLFGMTIWNDDNF